jgi:hypothetical protein
MVGTAYYVGTVDGELAVHLAVSSMNKGKSVEARACRLVTMPEWQGAGVGFSIPQRDLRNAGEGR